MTSKMEDVAADILRAMKLHGFTMLRVTKHGTLYGLDRFRMTLPNNPRDEGHNSGGNNLIKRWEEVKSEAYGAIPGLKQKVLERAADNVEVATNNLQPFQPLEVETPKPKPPQPREPETKPRFAPWTCPKCHRTYKHKGRHADACARGGSKRPYAAQRSALELIDDLQKAVAKLVEERDTAVQRLANVRRHLA